MFLQDDIRSLRGIGEKRAQAFHRLGIFSVYDLITWFPRRYEDRSIVKSIAETLDGEAVCIDAIVADTPVLQRVRRGMELVKLRAVDETGSVNITFFNQPYVRQQLERGKCYRFYGKIELHGSRRTLSNPEFEALAQTESRTGTTGRILPVYRLNGDLSRKVFLQTVRQALDCVQIPELLPDIVRQDMLPVQSAYEYIHFPSDFDTLSKARHRLVYEELFVLSCALSLRRQHALTESSIHSFQHQPDPDFNLFFAALPYEPTEAQRRAVLECARDITSGRCMNRLLQGDVGSGKTLVAAALIRYCTGAGKRSAFMAPTQILAEQHFKTLSFLFAPFGFRIGLYTATEKANPANCDVLVGTHALLNTDIPGLALAVTDEQHRFGVAQRAALTKGVNTHVLVMSATPIPRTLSLIIYGDLDVSVLDEIPPGRKPVETFCVDSRYRQRLLVFIRKLCFSGRQVYVVCPKIGDETESDAEPNLPELCTVLEETELLQVKLPELRIACVHGRLKAQEKDMIMRRFAEGEIQVLVSTTVIEVGVDVPNAALMLVENAERFGLSQLHQLRGRVGRGVHQSYCVLLTDHQSDETKARMKILCETNDGFRIAEEDLRLRGPGDFFGSRQHGLPELHVADLGTDTQTLIEAKAAADQLLAKDPELESCPLLRQHAEQLLENAGSVLN